MDYRRHTSIGSLFRELEYEKKTYIETPTGGHTEDSEKRIIKGIIRDLSGDDLLVAQKRNQKVSKRLYSSDLDLEFGGYVEGYKIVYINTLMDLVDFYQYDLEGVDVEY